MFIKFFTHWRERRDVIRALDRLDREIARVTQSRDDLNRQLNWHILERPAHAELIGHYELGEHVTRRTLFYAESRLRELKQRRLAILRDGRIAIPWWLH